MQHLKMANIVIGGVWQSEEYPSYFCFGDIEINSPVAIDNIENDIPYDVNITIKYKGLYRWYKVDNFKSQIIKKGNSLSAVAVYNNSHIKYELDCITMTGNYYLAQPYDRGTVKLNTGANYGCAIL